MENPHPFPGAATLRCTECHGGNPQGNTVAQSHVPPPPEVGDEENQFEDPVAYFNRLTLTGLDRYPDYVVNGQTYSALDYLQFIQPGDLRVVTHDRSCGTCHKSHVDCTEKSLLATEAGVFSGAMFSIGVDNQLGVTLYQDTAADLAFRAIVDPGFQQGPEVGPVPELLELPVFSVFGSQGASDIFNNNAYDANLLVNDINNGQVTSNSALANLYNEQVAFTCGNCHLGSAGANNRYGDFRSSGCTACHMRYSLDGRYTGTDTNIETEEPFDPDQIEAPERAHVQRHLIQSVARTLPSGETVQGIDDYTCAGCHQGSNRTVMQFWGIRLDQNQDVRRGFQYPANPDTFQNTRNDTRLFDPVVDNNTFNGRNANQYLLFEDYDCDGRDDTPADVHYEAGMGCIDCHGSHDLHGGTVGDVDAAVILSRQDQAVAIECESCHGGIEQYATTAPCRTYDGLDAECAVDAKGNALRHVTVDGNGHYYLVSRLTGVRHYIKQTRDTVDDNGKLHPFSQQPIYNEKASYAMGRVDADPTNGMGPLQTTPGLAPNNFSHTDNMSCVACHASWTNGCVGCHLEGEYDDRNNQFFFSNITGERIVFNEAAADFVYQTPVPFQLGVDTHNKITQISPNTETFFKYTDFKNETSQVFAFSDRHGMGANTGDPNRLPSLAHNFMMPYSIRGKVSDQNEGPRYCVGCHLTDDGLAAFATEYDDFRADVAGENFASLDFDLLQRHIGQNTGNQRNSPFWVHMVAGLGSGLFLFDENGCPTNPLDTNPNRFGCNDAPANDFAGATPIFNLDRIVEENGLANGSNNHTMLDGQPSALRDGSLDPLMAGPLGMTLLQKLADPVNGVVLDSWLDADSNLGGDAGNFVNGAPSNPEVCPP
jgi:hypothetical protein